MMVIVIIVYDTSKLFKKLKDRCAWIFNALLFGKKA